MDVTIEGRHFKVSEAIMEYVRKKVERLDKYFDGIHDLHVVLSVQDQKPPQAEAEIVCGLIRGQRVVAKGNHEDLYAAVDEAVRKSQALLTKYKDRLRTRKRESGRREAQGV
jgi:putative sigma-54 modulation protein